MKLTLPLAASTGRETDLLILGLVLVSFAVLALVFGLIGLYIVRYRYNSPIYRHTVAEKSFRFEISWTIGTLLIFFALSGQFLAPYGTPLGQALLALLLTLYGAALVWMRRMTLAKPMPRLLGSHPRGAR